MKTWTLLYLFLATIAVAGCESTDDSIKDDPYGGGKQPLGIKLTGDAPSPESGYPEDSVIFKAKGLLAYCDPAKGTYDFEFYMSDELTEIVTATDTTLTVKVPENVTTGITYLKLAGQVFFGPKFTVLGNINVDRSYMLYEKSIFGTVYNCLEHRDYPFSFFLAGDFTRIDNTNLGGLAMIDERGNLIPKQSTKYGLAAGISYNAGSSSISNGSLPYVNSISYLKDGRILVSGLFSNYNGASYVNNILVVNKDLTPNTTDLSLPIPSSTSTKWVTTSTFNGGSETSFVRSFVTSDDRIIGVGNFKTYARVNYDESNSMNIVSEYTPVSTLMEMNSNNGQLLTGYRTGKRGIVSGMVKDACMDKKDCIWIVGEFTSFDGNPVSNIVRVNPDGTVDETFIAGANGTIEMIRYNKKFDKAMVVGTFTEFNGVPCPGVAMVKSDGTLDEEFHLRDFEGGGVNFASILNNGKVVVSGTFAKYDGNYRRGFLVLDADGQCTQRFNVPGEFSGQLYQVVETETTIGGNGLLLMGSFTRFNAERVSNCVLLEVDFD